MYLSQHRWFQRFLHSPQKWDYKNGALIDLHIFGKISKATAPPMTSFQGKFIHQKRMMGKPAAKPAARPNQLDGTNHGFRLVAPPANQSMFKWANIFILLRLLLRGRRSQKIGLQQSPWKTIMTARFNINQPSLLDSSPILLLQLHVWWFWSLVCHGSSITHQEIGPSIPITNSGKSQF